MVSKLNMEGIQVTCDADLDTTVGKRSAAALTKSISFLDEHCLAFLARSPFLAVAVHGAGGPRIVGLAAPPPDGNGGEPDPAALIEPADPARLPLYGLDVAGIGGGNGNGSDGLVDGSPAAVLALVPGYGETLRVNGHLELSPRPHLRVTEAFLHCAKAILRSRLWTDGWADTGGDRDVPATTTATGWDPDVGAFLAGAPFVLLTSVDADGRADLSPRGDPPGLFHLLDGRRLAIADRRGNRRTDTLHNLVQNPTVGVLALTPGRAEVVELQGKATIDTEPGLLEALAVQGKRPKVAVVVEVEHAERRPEPAIGAAGLWDPTRHVEAGELPRAGKIWADHVRRHDGGGLVARASRRLVSERVLNASVALDYKSNLY